MKGLRGHSHMTSSNFGHFLPPSPPLVIIRHHLKPPPPTSCRNFDLVLELVFLLIKAPATVVMPTTIVTSR